MVEGQQRPLRAPLGPFPGLDVASLDPGDRVPRRPLDRRHGHRVEPAALQVPGDAGQHAAGVRLDVKDVREVASERRRVDQAANLRPVAQAARSQVQEPADDDLAQRPAVVPEDVVGRQIEPGPAEFLRRLDGAARVGREKRGVDRAGRDAGQHVEVELRQPLRQVPDQADLIGRAGAAAGEDEADPARAIPVAGLTGPLALAFSRHRRAVGSGGGQVQINSMRSSRPGAPASLRSAVSRTVERASARAT